MSCPLFLRFWAPAKNHTTITITNIRAIKGMTIYLIFILEIENYAGIKRLGFKSKDL